MNDQISVDFGDQEQSIFLHLAEDEGDSGTWMSTSRASYIAGLLTAAVEAINVKESA